eukprot:7296120-Lingulodinium_polyedra.AAC.1
MARGRRALPAPARCSTCTWRPPAHLFLRRQPTAMLVVGTSFSEIYASRNSSNAKPSPNLSFML